MDNIILCKDKQIATELLGLGCKLLSLQDGIYTIVNCSEKVNFADYKDRIILTNKLKF